MAAYVIAEIEITDPEGYKAYTQVVPATIAAYGGRFIVRGGAAEVLEGEWPSLRRVVLEFPSVEAAKAWWIRPSTRDRRPKEKRPRKAA